MFSFGTEMVNLNNEETKQSNNRELKITVLGSGGVGKSSLVLRLISGQFVDEYDPTIEDSYRKQVVIDDKPVLLDILDTAGQEEFAAMQDQWIRESQAFLLVYAIDSKRSFDYIDMSRRKIFRIVEDAENIPIVVVGNKCDLEQERMVHKDELISYCRMIDVPCFESSAKHQINVAEAFFQCYREWFQITQIKQDKKRKKKRKKKKKKKKSLKNHMALNMNDGSHGSEEKQTKSELSMDINIAVIGAHNVGKHTLIHHFMKLSHFNKTDVYYTSVATKESNAGDMDNALGYKQKLELTINVHCIDNNIDGEINNITKNNDAFLFVAEVTDKQSLVRCVELINNMKNDGNYSYTKPVIIVVTKWNVARDLWELTECDIAEFVNDVGVPFIKMSLDNFEQPFHRLLSAVRGYSTPSSFSKIQNLYQHQQAAWSLAQSLNGNYLYSTGNDGTVRIWDIESSVCVAVILYHTGKVYKVEECVCSCRYLISCADDGLCCVWNDFYCVVDVEHVQNNNNIPLFINCPRFIFKHRARVRSFCICNDNILCTVSDYEKMKLWSLTDGNLLYNSMKLGILNQVIYVKEYDKLFMSSPNKCIYVFELKRVLTDANHGCIKLEGFHSNNINELRVCKKSEDEIYVISMDESGLIRCWNAKNPSKTFVDFQRHTDSINYACICKVKQDNIDHKDNGYDYLLCTASRDKTMRGYSIPDGDIVFNIADSQDTLRAIDCNEEYIISAGKDNYIRCYKLMSNNINYQFRRYNIKNKLQISLKWAYQRHEGYLNRILCGKQQFKHMVFTADRNGIILGWDMNTGQCINCYGNDEAHINTIKAPKKEVRMEIITMLIQFMQLATFAFSININWGNFNDKYNPFSLSANLFQFDISKYSSSISWIDWFYENISIPFEWIISILCIAIFIVLFCMSYKFKYMADNKANKFKSILSFFCWITMHVGFVPILRNIFKVFVCHNITPYLINGESDCWSSVTHWIYICISLFVLILYLPTAYRVEARSGDLQQINAYYWVKWSKDYPQQRRVHFASPRTNSLASIDKSIVILMVAVSVFLVYGENANEEVELSAFEEKQLLTMDYVIIGILLTASAILCVAILIKPPFYFRGMNIFNAALFFGVLWTDLWSLFVINEEEVRQWSRLRRERIDQIKTIGHLSILLPFMLFGAALMWIRTHRNWFDEIRGGFRKSFHDKGIGIISENNSNLGMGYDDRISNDNVEENHQHKLYELGSGNTDVTDHDFINTNH